MSIATAAAGVVDVSTLERWLARGRAAQDLAAAGEPVPPAAARYVELLVAIDEATLELTEETREQIASRLATGADLEKAAAAAKVTGRALELWIERGRIARERRDHGQPAGASDLIYLQLLADVEEAEAAAEIFALATIKKGMINGDSSDAKWYLERKYPERYGRRQGRPPGIPPELRAELDALRQQTPAQPVDRLDALLANLAAGNSA